MGFVAVRCDDNGWAVLQCTVRVKDHNKTYTECGFSNYDAGNVIAKASQPRVVQLVRRSYEAVRNENV